MTRRCNLLLFLLVTFKTFSSQTILNDVECNWKQNSTVSLQHRPELLVFVGGLQRSGTTYVASQISLIDGIHQMNFRNASSSWLEACRPWEKYQMSAPDFFLVVESGGLEGKFLQSAFRNQFAIKEEYESGMSLERVLGARGNLAQALVNRSAESMAEELLFYWHRFWPPNAKRVVEKTPENVFLAPSLFKIFRPAARFVFVLREPLAWATSIHRWTFLWSQDKRRVDPIAALLVTWTEMAGMLKSQLSEIPELALVSTVIQYELLALDGFRGEIYRRNAFSSVFPGISLPESITQPKSPSRLRESGVVHVGCWFMGLLAFGSGSHGLRRCEWVEERLQDRRDYAESIAVARWEVFDRALTRHESFFNDFGYTLWAHQPLYEAARSFYHAPTPQNQPADDFMFELSCGHRRNSNEPVPLEPHRCMKLRMRGRVEAAVRGEYPSSGLADVAKMDRTLHPHFLVPAPPSATDGGHALVVGHGNEFDVPRGPGGVPLTGMKQRLKHVFVALSHELKQHVHVVQWQPAAPSDRVLQWPPWWGEAQSVSARAISAGKSLKEQVAHLKALDPAWEHKLTTIVFLFTEATMRVKHTLLRQAHSEDAASLQRRFSPGPVEDFRHPLHLLKAMDVLEQEIPLGWKTAARLVLIDDIHHARILNVVPPRIADSPIALSASDLLRRGEVEVFQRCTAVAAVSDEDKRTISDQLAHSENAAAAPSVHWLPFVVAPAAVFSNTPFSRRTPAMLACSESHPIAVQSLQWFVDSVLPSIVREVAKWESKSLFRVRLKDVVPERRSGTQNRAQRTNSSLGVNSKRPLSTKVQSRLDRRRLAGNNQLNCNLEKTKPEKRSKGSVKCKVRPQQISSHYLHVAGDVGSRISLSRDMAPAVSQPGRVSDEHLEALYASCRVFVAPFKPTQSKEPSGVATKVINALAHGIPVVTSTLGAAGVFGPPLERPPLGLLVVDSAREMAEVVTRLLTDEQFWEKHSEGALSHLKAHMTPRALGNALRHAVARDELESHVSQLTSFRE